MSFFRRLWTGCYAHDDQRERDAAGRAILVCQTCGRRQGVLESEIVRGPQHEQAPVLGHPRGKARRQWPEKVRELRRSEK
jgi:hypothetical protein